MGQSIRDIRRRINSVRSTSQITRAMEMVSVAKLRRAQEQLAQARPFAGQLADVVRRLLADPRLHRQLPGVSPAVVTGRASVSRVAYVVITSDRGLAGGYNVNLVRFARTQIESDSCPYLLYCIGRKGRHFFERLGWPVQGGLESVGDNVDFLTARKLGSELWELFVSSQVDQVDLIYQQFLGVGHQRPVRETLLPLTRLVSSRIASTGDATRLGKGPEQAGEGADTEATTVAEYIYVPSREQVLALLLPRLVHNELYRVLLEAKASEHGARRTAMHQATENAEEMLRALQLSYNKARQAAITKELVEIVGGAETLTAGGGQ
ncbi:MAG: ATP synthase F1 subunit gamma [Limnochordaceae bacterium]|nr:ATP synthase F1 subunit gamma [Limnochordaceae bacterium]